MIRRKLPSDFLIQLEIITGADSKLSVRKLRDLLRQYIVAKEKAELNDAMTRKSTNKGATFQVSKPTYGFKNFNQGTPSGALITSEKPIVIKREKTTANCRYCGKSHWSDECQKYTSIEDRKKQIRGSCYRCLKEGHLSSECKTSKTCVYCGVMNAHHRSLCEKKFKRSNPKESINLSEELEVFRNTNTESVTEEVGLLSYDQTVMMQTAKTDVKEPNGEKGEEIRLLLDSGSHRTYITEDLENRLGLKEKEEQEIQLVTFGSATSKVIKTKSTELSLKMKNGQYMALTANIVPNITGTITRKPVKLQSPMKFKELTRNLSLADIIPKESKTLSLDLSIGNDYYLDIIRCDKIEVQQGLYLLSSTLGWILSGRTDTCATRVKSTEMNMLILTYGNNVAETNLCTKVDDILPTKPNLEDFWNMEAIGITDRVEQSEDENAMEIFKDTRKCENGRYQVTWPWRDDIPDLPENRGLAKGRLKSLVNKLENTSRFNEEV